ncbi:phage holin family protein [uncultured Draconibacterium sp.]|uniref:phage holin family protein n=1 Tax=uncultured Draconibacterium sp. TaxID=1573823 RepID=UPI003217943E
MLKSTINYMLVYIPNLLTGFLATIAGYFAPIKGMAIVMLTAIIIDLILGVWASRTTGEGIKSKKLWRTGYKILIALIIVHLLYSVDKEMGISGINTAKIGALIITGWEIWSIFESAAVISDHPAFRMLKKYMENKVKEKTGIEIENEL